MSPADLRRIPRPLDLPARIDPAAAPGNMLLALARLLRHVRDKRQAEQAASKGGGA